MDERKIIKSKSMFDKILLNLLIAFLICTLIFTVIYIIDTFAFSGGLEIPLWVSLLIWLSFVWVVFLFYLMRRSSIFPKFFVTFDQTGIFIIEQTRKLGKQELCIKYKDILEIEYGKFSLIQLGIFLNLIKAGRMRIKYKETELKGHEIFKTTEISMPYSKVKAVIKLFNLNIKLVNYFSF